MRQSIGIIIVLFSLKYIKNHKFIKYAIGILIASLFHTSALIFLPFYFMHKIKVNPFFILIIMVLISRSAGFVRNFIVLTSNKLGIYSDYFGGVFDNGQYSMLQVMVVLLVMLFLCLSRIVLGKKIFIGIMMRFIFIIWPV